MRGEKKVSLMQKHHDIHPFDNVAGLESYSKKYDSSLFCFGSHQKKRPHNLVMGRMYNFQLLDMFEFGVENYAGMKEFKPEHIEKDQKPVLVFQGEQFEYADAFIWMKNLFIGSI